MHIERVAPVAKAVFILLLTSVSIAAISAISHSHWHTFSNILRFVAIGIGFLALLKIANHVLRQSFVAKFVHWIHALCFEVITFSILFVLRLTSHKLFAKGIHKGKPILLVHGYCNHGSVWTYMQRQLALKMGPIYAINLGHPFRPLQEYAEKVKIMATKIRQETNHPNLILIGHSMGGVISSMVATDDPEGIDSVITIGSPLNGTPLARIGLGQNAREMERKSELVSSLNQKFKTQTKTKFYHIASKTDQIVFPGHSALLGNEPKNEFLFEDLGHASLLFSPRVADLLLQIIPSDNEDLQCKEGNKPL